MGSKGGPFFLFMKEVKSRREARGETFPRGFEDVIGIAGEMWNSMTQEQKDVYRQKHLEYKLSQACADQKLAARASGRSRRTFPGKKTRQTDEYIEDPVQCYPSDNEDAVAEFKRKCKKDQDTLSAHVLWNLSEPPNAVLKEPFYVISVLHHGRDRGYTYFPAEIAVVEMTLAGGIGFENSLILGPYDLPGALREKAAAFSAVNKIPLDLAASGVVSDVMTAMEMLAACRPPNRRYRFFCIKKEYNAVQGSLQYLKTHSHSKQIPGESVACIDDLLVVLRRWKDKVTAPKERQYFDNCDGLGDSVFARWTGLACSFHTERASEICALATAKRACYFFLRCLHADFKIDLTANHLPPMSATQNLAPLIRTYQTWMNDEQLTSPRARVTAEGGHVGDGGSSSSRRRSRILESDHSESDLGGPSTLPTQLRGLTLTKQAPDAWCNVRQEVASQEPKNASTGRLASESSLADADSAINSVGQNTAARQPPDQQVDISEIVLDAGIQWGQNEQLRRQIYAERGINI